MAQTNNEKSDIFKRKNLKLGRSEMRAIWADKEEQVILKKLCRYKLKELRKSR